MYYISVWDHKANMLTTVLTNITHELYLTKIISLKSRTCYHYNDIYIYIYIYILKNKPCITPVKFLSMISKMHIFAKNGFKFALNLA
jgi:hypothetical protein